MKPRMLDLIVLLAAGTLAAAGCTAKSTTGEGGESTAVPAGTTAVASAGATITRAVAVIEPTEGSRVHGVVRLAQHDGGVTVTADLSGFEPGTEHGFHIHEYGDCSAPDGTSAGGHYNPEGNPHALPPDTPRHAGDLGNLSADAEGNAHYEITVDDISIAGPKNPVLGRAFIIHAKPDDGGQPTGNAGARLACGVIGIANPE